MLVFTGFTLPEVKAMTLGEKFLSLVDLLVAGPYRADQVCSPKGLISSANQRVYFLSQRYGPLDLAKVPLAEVIIEPDGKLVLTGILPLEV